MDFLTLVIWFVAALIVMPLVFKGVVMAIWVAGGLWVFLMTLLGREPPNY